MNRITHSLGAALLAGGVLAGAGWAPAALAAAPAHDHASVAAKPLPAGTRWKTDAPLREGMGRIRQAYAAQLQAIHADKLTPEQYRQLATETETQVGQIVASCKLPPDSDAALHGILAHIGEGTDAMAGKSPASPRDGAIQVVMALDEYGRSFNHPGWKPLGH